MINREFGVLDNKIEFANLGGIFGGILIMNSFSRPRSPIRRTRKKIGRNNLCFCGSKKKYKKCCISKKRVKALKERRQK